MESANKELDYIEQNFVPTINRKSQKMVQGNFEHRQQAFEQRRQESIKKISSSAKRDFTYEPKINQNSSAILKRAQQKRDYLSKTFDELDPELGMHGIKNQVI